MVWEDEQVQRSDGSPTTRSSHCCYIVGTPSLLPTRIKMAPKFRVRPRRGTLAHPPSAAQRRSSRYAPRSRSEQIVVPCTPELTSLLACFATSGDLQHKAECSTAAKNLHKCMETRPKNNKGRKSEVNPIRAIQRSSCSQALRLIVSICLI